MEEISGLGFKSKCPICKIKTERKLCGFHESINETGEILFHDNQEWGKNNNHFQIVLPRSVYEEKAGSKCWVLVDHIHRNHEKHIFVMFIMEVSNEYHLPFALKLRKENRAILDMDNVIEKLAIFYVYFRN